MDLRAVPQLKMVVICVARKMDTGLHLSSRPRFNFDTLHRTVPQHSTSGNRQGNSIKNTSDEVL